MVKKSFIYCIILKKQSLRDRIDEASKTGIKFDPETTILGWALQAVSGLKYLHHNGIIHRDINPSYKRLYYNVIEHSINNRGLNRPQILLHFQITLI